MCGISGYWDLEKKLDNMQLQGIVHAMNEQIRHRGPDEEGFYQKGSLCMGMRRLSVIDLQGGSQPVYNENKSIAVVYNGEIYNYQKLRKELRDKGHKFSTDTDTEVIVHAFEEYGSRCFDLFEGMFAFALYDEKRNRLFLARDRMGEKPLYYTTLGGHIIFGSELKCLLSTGRVDRIIDIRALNQFLQLTYIPAPLTIYENVYKLRPGHFLEISEDGAVKDTEYWDIPVSGPKTIDYRDAVRHLRKLLAVSVKQRMVSDVPVGAFLSGGVDSASIVGLMKHRGNGAPETFTIGSDIKGYDERRRAKEAAELNHTVHHEKVIEYESFPAAMQMIMGYMDEPFADSSVLPTFLVSEFAKKSVTVALTGDAGDELFAGYNKYLSSYYGKLYGRIPKVVRDRVIEPTFLKYSGTGRLARKVGKVIKNVDRNPKERHKALMHMGVKENEIEELMAADYQDMGSMDFIDAYFEKHAAATELQKELYTDLKVVLEGDMLVKVDRMSMLHSLETRIPLLSKDIIEFSMNLPDEFKLKGKKRKRILKDAMRPLLPEGFDKYPKSGFEAPISEWLKNEMRDELERLLSRERIEAQGIFNYDYIEKIKKEHFDGKKNRRDELWVLFIFEKWYEKEKL